MYSNRILSINAIYSNQRLSKRKKKKLAQCFVQMLYNANVGENVKRTYPKIKKKKMLTRKKYGE